MTFHKINDFGFSVVRAVRTIGKFFYRHLQRAADWIAARLLQIEDYFLLPVNIRASEIFLFCLSLLWLIWFVAFDIQNASPNVNKYIWNRTGWIGIFTVFAGLHISGLVIPAYQLRQFGVFGYCVIWFFWTIIVGFSAFQSQVFPTCVCLFILSIYVTLNVLKDTKHLDTE